MKPFLASLAVALAVYGQEAKDAPKETERGIPVTDSVTIAKCGGCHRPDKDGNLSRISWIRTTPEGWQQAIKRMVRLTAIRRSVIVVKGADLTSDSRFIRRPFVE